MEADKCWATGPDCQLGDESGESCFRQRHHASLAMLECFGSFRLIVSHELSFCSLVAGLTRTGVPSDTAVYKYRKGRV